MDQLPERQFKLNRLIDVLTERKDEFATLISNEMGKPIKQAVEEMDKTIGHINYYVEKSPEFLATEDLDLSSGQQGAIYTQPLGVTLVILPFNFPFWMPFKSALGSMMIGNPIIMKHSQSTPQCAQALEDAFLEAGFTSSEFTNIYCTEQQVEKIIADPRVRAVKFTGSTRGGTHIAKLCGRYLKKGTFELTGNDPFLVLEEANI